VTPEHLWDLGSLLSASHFLQSTNVGIVLHDTRGVVLECNLVAAEFFGATIEGLVGRYFHDEQWGAVDRDGVAIAQDRRPESITLATGTRITGTIIGFDVTAKARCWVTVNTSPAIVGDVCVGVISSFVDITSQIQREHTMRLMRAVNSFAMSTSDETQLLQNLCNEMVALSDYSLAWIAMESDTEFGAVLICYSAGKSAFLYPGMVSTLANKDSGLGPTGTALRLGVTQVANDLKSQHHYELWRARATMFGLSSNIAIPFLPGGRRAVLSIYDRHPFAFDAVTQAGLEEITREIEGGIAYQHSLLHARQAHEETSIAVRSRIDAEELTNQSEQRFRLAFENNMAPMVFSNLDGVITASNDAYCKMVGLAQHEVVGHDSTTFTHPDDIDMTGEMHQRLLTHRDSHVRFVKRYLAKQGGVVFSEVSLSAARDQANDVLYFVSSERDITEERELSTRLSHQALHDPLTGLANRALLDDRLAQARARVTRDGALIAVLMIDLDDFKGVNDTYGHPVGDLLLVGVARRLEKASRPTDTLCRFGGDEFLYLADGLTSAQEAEELARRFLASLEAPFSCAGVTIEQHASVGIVTWDASTPGDFALVKDADVALFEAKRINKGGIRNFDVGMQNVSSSRFTLNRDLRHSLHVGELTMMYQPIVDLATHAVVGFEALMRWQHPERGAVDPGFFIPLAEQTDMILELGSFALREATFTASSWTTRDAVTGPPYISVNLAPRQLHDPQLASMIDETLSNSGLAPERLVLEITETTALVDISETLSVLAHLEDLGIRIALDDFGTGYSSLSYLLKLRPRFIKIDRSFVSPEMESSHNELLLETIITLGQKLGVTLLAEGAETAGQVEKLRHLGCKFGQGYLFSPAVAARDVTEMLAASSG
jgi:diguanylate cyclase (GGDEF)-like protein/PAS domain S-box-containing protein